ncbi:MAG: S66 peptidase family protein [Caulobacteraceae bacterium]
MKAKRLIPGDTLGLVAPASPSDADTISKMIEGITQLGFKLKVGESVYSQRGYLSGNDELRARDINEMFRDKEVSGIFCSRGGYGSLRILDMLDYRLIKNNPKVFMGFSDITVILNAIYKKTGLVTFHGPVGGAFARDMNRATITAMEKALECSDVIGEIMNPPAFPIRVIAPGKASGRLVGGNLSMVAAALGTEYEIDTKDRILFLEDVGEEPYRVDRMLHQLKLAGKLDDAAGIILGDWKKCIPENPEKSLSLEEVFEDVFAALDKPVLAGYQFGHSNTNLTVPVGAKASIDTSSKAFIITESGVE